MNFNKNIITLGLLALLIAPTQSLKAEAPAWLKSYGAVAGMAALGAAVSYGLCKVFSQREVIDTGFVAPKSPFRRTVTWTQADAAKQENDSLQRALDSDPSIRLTPQGWARRSENVQKIETYRKECRPRALTHDEQEKLHEIEVKMPMFTSRTNVALFSSSLFGIAGFLASRQTKTGVPFFVAAGVTALGNWFFANGKKQEYSAQLKALDDKIEKYTQEGPQRQASFSQSLGNAKRFDEIKNLIENGDIDSSKLIALRVTNNREITLSPLAFAIAADRQDVRELLEKDYNRTYASVSSPEDHRDIVYYCAETGDLHALQRLLGSWQFSACPERSDIIQEAYNKALQNKQYHLLRLLDDSTFKWKSNKDLIPYNSTQARRQQFAQAVGTNSFKTIQVLFAHYNDVDVNETIIFSFRNKTNQKKLVSTTPLMHAAAHGHRDLQKILFKQPNVHCIVATTPDHLDILTYCAELGDKQAIERLVSLPNFFTHQENINACARAYVAAVQNKHYHLLGLLDHSPDKQKARTLFASLNEMFDTLEDAEKSMLKQVPLFNEIRNNYTQEIRELLRNNNLQQARELFCQKHVGSLGDDAVKVFIQTKKKLDSESDNKNQAEKMD